MCAVFPTLAAWTRALKAPLLVYLLLGIALWPLPLLNRLHVESAAVVAGVAFFAAGLSSLRLFRAGWSVRRVFLAQEAALAVPWALLTVALLWAPNCGYLQGLLFFFLFPVITVVLAVGLAFALHALPGRRTKTLFVGIGLGVLVLTPLYDVGLHPQFYTYNHIFGGVLGPIYDEELAIRPGLFAFRGLTLLWATGCFLAGAWWRSRRLKELAGAVSVILLIGGCYLFSAQLGFNTPAWYLQRALGGHHQTTHFNLYYDPASLTADELRRLAADHEYHYHRLADRLEVDVEGRIDSYLYPNPDVKARLTGARRTNVAPVWLPAPQTHVLLEEHDEAFPHELAHVFSREFGVPGIHASVAVGLVEGIAVALEPPDGQPGPHDQVSAALMQPGNEGPVNKDLAESLADRLDPLGFWTGRGAVSYTAMGSFVRYLLDTYGAARFKRAYAWARFDVYGKSADALAQEWKRTVLTQPVVARAAGPLMQRRFGAPSLFEKRCPHYVPRYRRRYRAGQSALEAGDTTTALARFEAALAQQPDYKGALAGWARIKLARRQPDGVVARLDTLGTKHRSARLNVYLGDAYALLHRPAAARKRYGQALDQLPLYAHDVRSRLLLRTALADRPDVIHILTSRAPPAAQAARLAPAAPASPAAQVLRALRLYEAGAYEQAGQLLRSTPASEIDRGYQQATLKRQRRIWLATTAYRLGEPARALAYIQQAVQAYRTVGDLDTVARLEVLADKVRWRQP